MSSYSEGQTHQLMDALESKGKFSSEEITRLGQYNNLSDIRKLLNGQVEIRPVGQSGIPLWIPIGDGKTIIAVNLGASPNLPFAGVIVESHLGEGWALVEKRKNGLYIDGKKVILHLSKRQLGENHLTGHELREELTRKPVLNSNLLDALHENPHLIPEDWKRDKDGNTRYIFFWATVFRDPASDCLYVRYLYFRDGSWYRFYYWLDDDWGSYGPAVLLAS